MLLTKLLVLDEVFWSIVVANKAGIGGHTSGLLDDDNITGNKLTSKDILFLTLADDGGAHGDVTLEGSDDIGSLLLLIPTDGGVEEQNTNNDTEIDPGTKTGSEEDSEFHDCKGISVLHGGSSVAWRDWIAPVAPSCEACKSKTKLLGAIAVVIF